MAKRLTGNTTTGRPGYGRGISVTGGGLVNRTKAAKSSVKRLFARDPSKGAFSQFGTKRDILNFTNHPRVPNTNDAPNPTIIRGSEVARKSTQSGVKKVVPHNTNRRVKRLR